MANPLGSQGAEPQRTGLGGVLLRLRFATRDDDPRCEEIAALLEDVEAIYRAAPAAAALGLPVAELMREYRVARADSLADFFHLPLDPREWSRLRRRLPFPEFEEFLYFLSRGARRGRDPRYGPLPLTPEHPLRVRELSMRSPLDFLAHIPAEYLGWRWFRVVPRGA